MIEAEAIVDMLKTVRLPVNSEAETQVEMMNLFTRRGVWFHREFVLDRANRIDFLFAGGIGMEVKLKGSAMNIFRQCRRYCEFDQIKQLILVSNKAMGFPGEINGKPCHFHLVVELIGLKSSQQQGITDPFSGAKTVHSDDSRIKLLAERFLKNKGKVEVAKQLDFGEVAL